MLKAPIAFLRESLYLLFKSKVIVYSPLPMIIYRRRALLWGLKFMSFLVGAFACFYLQSEFALGAVVAASLTGVLGSFIPESRHIDSVHVQANIYMGAFVAMGSRIVQLGAPEILLVSFIGSSVYFLIQPYMRGFGGRLGLIAFISSLLGLWVR